MDMTTPPREQVDPLEPVEGRPCPVCGLPDPDHDWNVHDAAPPPQVVRTAGRLGAALPNMLQRSSTRGRHLVRVACLHTTEGILRARDLRAWSSWPGSSHAAADADGVLLTPADGFVPYHLAAWTLRSGNPWSDNLELCAFARWTRTEWLARPKLLEAAAAWLADRHMARGVPLVKITAQQYRDGAWGVIDHDDHTDGYQDGTHWDVGENFPWDVVIPRARAIVAELVAANTPAVPAPAGRNPYTLEDSVELTPNHTTVLPVPPVPAGMKAVLSVVGDTVHGCVIYSKGMYGGHVAPVLSGGPDWLLWLAPGKREDRDVSGFQVVELNSLGADDNQAAVSSAIITLQPAG